MTYQVDNKKIAKNTLALYFRMGFTMAVAFIATRVTLKVLGVGDFGLNNLVSGVVALFSFLNASLGTAVQRYYSIEIGKGNSKRLKTIFGSALSMHFIVAFVTVALMEIFAVFFLHKLNIPVERMHASQTVFQISIISLFFNILSVPYSAMLRAREKFSSIATIDIVQAILRLGVLYLLYTINYDKLITLSLLNFAISLFYIGSLVVLASKEEACHSAFCWDKDIINGMMKFISMLILTVLASLFRDKGVIVLINLFFGLAINAAYAVAMQVMSLTNSFVTNFKQSMVPQMMASYGYGDLSTMHRLINLGTKITFLLMLAISMPIMFECEYILGIWLGTPPKHTSELVILALINVNISSFTYFLYQGVQATGNITKQQSVFSLLYMLNVLLIFLFFKLGANFSSALYVTIMISVLQCVVNLYFSKQAYSYNIRNFILHIFYRCVVAVGIYYLGFRLLYVLFEPSFLRLFISVFVSIVFCVCVGIFIILDRKERENVMKKLLNIYNRRLIKNQNIKQRKEK